MKLHKIVIKQKEGERPAHGILTEVYLDGEKLRGVSSIKYSVAAGGLAKIEIEMLGSIEIDQLLNGSQISVNIINLPDISESNKE